MQKHIGKTFNLALVVLFLALTGAWDSGAFAQLQVETRSSGELTSAAEAKRTLDTIGTRDFKRVKDARLRDAGARALAALKKVAKNTSKAREAALVADFNRTMEPLKLAIPQPKSAGIQECDGAYDRCMELCKLTGGNCQLCAWNNNLCYINRLTIELVEGEDPKNDP